MISKKTVVSGTLLILFDIFAYNVGLYIKELSSSPYKARYPASLLSLSIEHILMVTVATLFSVIVGVLLGVIATRKWGNDFLYPINLIASVSQSFPPVAVLAIAVPIVGFGSKPILIALFAYGLFPIIQNTIAGIKSIEPSIKEASIGMGMGATDILVKVELPLAAGTILAGVKTTTIINIGVAAVGAVVGAGGLGAPMISGLIDENQFYIAYASIAIAFLSIFMDSLLTDLETIVTIGSSRKSQSRS